MNRQRELNIGFVTEHEKLRRNTNSFWGPEMAPFVYTSSRWGVDSSREGLPDSNIGSSCYGSSHRHRGNSSWLIGDPCKHTLGPKVDDKKERVMADSPSQERNVVTNQS